MLCSEFTRVRMIFEYALFVCCIMGPHATYMYNYILSSGADHIAPPETLYQTQNGHKGCLCVLAVVAALL